MCKCSLNRFSLIWIINRASAVHVYRQKYYYGAKCTLYTDSLYWLAIATYHLPIHRLVCALLFELLSPVSGHRLAAGRRAGSRSWGHRAGRPRPWFDGGWGDSLRICCRTGSRGEPLYQSAWKEGGREGERASLERSKLQWIVSNSRAICTYNVEDDEGSIKERCFRPDSVEVTLDGFLRTEGEHISRHKYSP